jgi:peptidoglycan hydrolase-like protein with peptidoglycan-binding domain
LCGSAQTDGPKIVEACTPARLLSTASRIATVGTATASPPSPPHERIRPRGQAGQDTLNAVKSFQTAMGLGSDGQVGSDTWRKSLDFIVP